MFLRQTKNEKNAGKFNDRRRADNRKVIGIAFLFTLSSIGSSLSIMDVLATHSVANVEDENVQEIVELQDLLVPKDSESEEEQKPVCRVLIIQEDIEATTSTESESQEFTSVDAMTEVEIVTEYPRENTLYCVIKDGYRYDLDDKYQDYLWKQCQEYEVTEYYELLLAQMYHESNFKKDVVSSTKDYGLMQINIFNHEWLSDVVGDDDFLNPYTSIRAGVYLMSDFLHKYGDVQKALVCYNRGESAVINGTYTTSYSRCIVEDVSLLTEKY